MLNPFIDCVTSKTVEKILFIDEKSELIVKFKNSDAVYLYKNVLSEVFLQLSKAPSKGSFIAKNIKGKYEFTKITFDEDGEPYFN